MTILVVIDNKKILNIIKIEKDPWGIDILKKQILYVSIIIFTLMNSVVYAGFIQGSSGAGWQSWTELFLNEDNNPYWDGDSWDGSDENVGNYLTNTGGFVGSSEGPGAIDYWGISGSVDPSFYFKSGSSAYNAVIKFEIAGCKNYNTFGWYEVDSGIRHELFNGITGPGSMSSFSPGEDYGLYLISKENIVFYTQSELNRDLDTNSLIDTSVQHFAVFRDTIDYSFWIGVEDLLSGSGYNTDLDYNDFGAKINSVPEPATMLLLGSSLIALAGYGRKKILKKTGSNKK